MGRLSPPCLRSRGARVRAVDGRYVLPLVGGIASVLLVGALTSGDGVPGWLRGRDALDARAHSAAEWLTPLPSSAAGVVAGAPGRPFDPTASAAVPLPSAPDPPPAPVSALSSPTVATANAASPSRSLPVPAAPRVAAAPAAAVPVATPQSAPGTLTGAWAVTLRPQATAGTDGSEAAAPGYRLDLEQRGKRLTGRGTAAIAGDAASQRTRVTVNGTVDGAHVTFTIAAPGRAARTFVLDRTADGAFSGTFWGDGLQGTVRAVRAGRE